MYLSNFAIIVAMCNVLRGKSRCLCIIIPEDIHINPFTYESILDMDIVDLLSLYSRAKNLWVGVRKSNFTPSLFIALRITKIGR